MEFMGSSAGQISGPLFRDVDQVEGTLRTMQEKELVEFTSSGNWKLRRAVPLTSRFASRF